MEKTILRRLVDMWLTCGLERSFLRILIVLIFCNLIGPYKMAIKRSFQFICCRTAAERSFYAFLLIGGCRTFICAICNHLNFLQSDWSILKWLTDVHFCCKRRRFILTNKKRPFSAATRRFVSGGVRTGTLPPGHVM